MTLPERWRLLAAKKTKSEKSPQVEGPQVIRTQDSPSFYSNRVQSTTTQLDFALIFLQMLPAENDEGGPLAREVARVFISPLLAKAVRDMMNRQIAAYEENYGKIPDSPG